jgi:outer membrane biosynthesis protein TonB
MAIGVPYEFDKMEKGDLSGSIPPDNQDPTSDPITIPEPEPTPQNNPEPIPESVPEKTSTPEPTPTPVFSDSSVLANLNKKKGTSFK